MNEVSISKKSDSEVYQNTGAAIEALGGVIVGPGYEQLDYPMDQIYIDYNLKGKILTLHLEHYLGISIFSKQMEVQELEFLSQAIAAKLA